MCREMARMRQKIFEHVAASNLNTTEIHLRSLTSPTCSDAMLLTIMFIDTEAFYSKTRIKVAKKAD